MKKIAMSFIVIALLGASFFLGKLVAQRELTATEMAAIAPEKSVSSALASNAITTGIAEMFTGTTHSVRPGMLIMDAVRKAKPGDTILVYPGDYHETVYIDKDTIRLRGVIDQGRRATLVGKKILNDAILYSGNNIVVENFKITAYKGNGIMGQAGNNFEIRNNLIVDTGVYGIFPQLGTNGLVEHNILSGIEDAAIYVGMSDHIHVAHNEVFANVAGIEIENSRHAIVENNLVYNNAGGILAFVTPGLPIKTAEDIIIRNNFVSRNNHKNFAPEGSTVAGIPSGTGILVMAADRVTIEDNIITDNKVAGILITDHAHAANITADPESQPDPDAFAIYENQMHNNGYDTIAEIKALGALELSSGGVDIVAVGPSRGSCINAKHQYRTIGLKSTPSCRETSTDAIPSYLLPEPAKARKIAEGEQGKVTFLGVCSGCHAYEGRLIGPAIAEIQEIYRDNPEGLAHYLAAPVKKRPDYPEMPPQDYLPKKTRLAVAEYLLSL